MTTEINELQSRNFKLFGLKKKRIKILVYSNLTEIYLIHK